MPTYNKLVRDLIPQIIEQSGKKYKTTTLTDREYITELRAKLQEEVQEYLTAESDLDSIEELADILEIIHALASTHNSSKEVIEKVRQEKVQKRGAFRDKVYLIDVED